MLVPVKWIRDYVNIDMDTVEFADKMTMTGTKVETIEFLGEEINNVVVGKIEKITQHPNADKLGLGVGTFPGQTHAFEDMWWYWDEDKQEWKPTHGIKATMPMYSAYMEIIQNVVKVAKEVFS